MRATHTPETTDIPDDAPPILVLGATGSVGGRLDARLRNLGATTRPAARHTAIPFDWDDDSTWEPALRGVRRMFLMAPDRVPVNPDFVALAADLGVEHLLLLSSRAIDVIGDQRLLDAEDTVKESGTGWTILRADWFDQNFDEGPFLDSVHARELAMPMGDCRQTFVDLTDVAAVAAVILTAPATEHARRTYEVTGPHALTFAEVCAIIGDTTGHPIKFHGDPASYRAAHTAFGRPAEEIERELTAYAALRSLGDSKPLDTVPRLTGRPARSFQEYAAGVSVWS
ncbi:SDR family NAD(P)-dependent oxidoreductase [Streptomyces uncialis]|uniref:SDR family NAD(P)-dependent oxidoreductase n=1 Tax=Streptomyces uncialis TaxID=1048205 RepID=UPI00381FAE90